MIVVDSSVWIAQLRSLDRPAVQVLEDLKNPRAILVGDIVLLEVLRALETRSKRPVSSAS